MITRLDREAIQNLTDRLLNARESNLKMVLDIGHRLETLGEIGEVEFINDAKSTTTDATAYSLRCIDKPVIWLLSCMDHQQDLSKLSQAVEDGVRCIYYLGFDDAAFVEQFVDEVELIERCDSMGEMLQAAAQYAEEGDCVLYSPACPSSAGFSGYAQRGETFRAAYRSLI